MIFTAATPPLPPAAGPRHSHAFGTAHAEPRTGALPGTNTATRAGSADARAARIVTDPGTSLAD
jgi:hypothetical protein